MEALSSGLEARFEQSLGHPVFSDSGAVEGGDEHAALDLGSRDEELGQMFGGVRAGGLFFGEEDLQVWVGSTEVGGEGSVDEEDAGAYAAGEGCALLCGGPAEERAVGVGGVGGG